MTQVPASSHGGAVVIAHQAFDFGSDVSIGNGAAANVRWNGTPSYDTLLSTTVDTSPTAIATGVYAFTIEVAADEAMTVGGFFGVTLGLNNGDDNVTIHFHSSIATAGDPFPVAVAIATWYVKAGKGISVAVANNDGVAARLFVLNQAAVQRLA